MYKKDPIKNTVSYLPTSTTVYSEKGWEGLRVRNWEEVHVMDAGTNTNTYTQAN